MVSRRFSEPLRGALDPSRDMILRRPLPLRNRRARSGETANPPDQADRWDRRGGARGKTDFLLQPGYCAGPATHQETPMVRARASIEAAAALGDWWRFFVRLVTTRGSKGTGGSKA